MELRKTFRFEASHVLPKHSGKCSRLHGHSWVLHVSVKGAVDKETGFVQDFADISGVIKPIIDTLDHRHLGTWGHILTDVGQLEDEHHHDDWFAPGLPLGIYPSSENLLIWIASQLAPLDVLAPLGTMYRSRWSSVALEETCTSYALLTREEYESGLQR